MSNEKLVYFFGGNQTEGNAEMRDLLGGKGANLAEMTTLGIPVPPGFTIATKGCDLYYRNNRQLPQVILDQVDENLKKLEDLTGKKLGDPKNPLLVSVRSGAAVSMPGMMDTILNLGLNDSAVEGLAELTGNPRFAWDSYRRFIQMFSDVALGMDINLFESLLEKKKQERGVESDTDLNAADLKDLVIRYKEVFKVHQNRDFPQDAKSQLIDAIYAVFRSWQNEKAIKYRRLNNIEGLLGTAVNVQSMVFGNSGEGSGTGVCFSRDPSTGENYFYGEYLMNAQGEDVVAGIRTPLKLSVLEKENPTVYKQLVEIKDRLEAHYRDMQDMEFTIEQGKLYLLQTRNGKRTGNAAVKIAVDMVKEGAITKEIALTRVTPDQLDQIFHPMLSPASRKNAKVIAVGLNASPGAATGQIVFTAEDAEAQGAQGRQVILCRKETSPEDIGGMHAAQGILTSTGGMTSHAAVVARGMGRPCVAGCKDAVIDGKTLTVGGKTFSEGDWISIDGKTGEVFGEKLDLVQPSITGDVETFLGWADEVKNAAVREGVPTKGFHVRTNADTPEDAVKAREYGAEGIGLCRTEHMFFGEGKLEHFQRMILADNLRERKEALKKILELQRTDFDGIFEAMNGLPVTIRLLDPPLHEFLPHTQFEIKELADKLQINPTVLKTKVDQLHELNPMLGHRGCRLGVTYPEIYDMQVEAIISSACALASKGISVTPEIMIPLVGTQEELAMLRQNAISVAESVIENCGTKIEYRIGSMIEIPRAAITADEIAAHADFFSFGTNDLTQMTYGFSRDDIGSFLPAYREKGILHHDPFASIDVSGVGRLVQTAVGLGRKTKPELKMGICGEHGGDPRSIEFFYTAGLNYVSCSPFRVPIARLAAAQTVLKNK